MKKVFLIALLAAATTVVACGGAGSGDESATGDDDDAPAGTKKTRIHFTKNHNRGTGPGQYDTDCIGIVTTETLKADKGDKLRWVVKTNNGQNDDDKCDSLTDLTQVYLNFDSDVVGASRRLQSDDKGKINGTISTVDAEIEPLNKYYVTIGTTPAGPDPVIVVDCGGCGPPPAGPGE